MQKSMLIRILMSVTFSALSLHYLSCGTSEAITRPQDVIFPDSNVSYVRHVEPFLRLGCAFSGCHAALNPIPLDSYIALFQTPGLIIPKQPDISTLSQVISGKLSHTYNISQSITDNHKKGIATWILEGASPR